jgi:hypothetical protein
MFKTDQSRSENARGKFRWRCPAGSPPKPLTRVAVLCAEANQGVGVEQIQLFKPGEELHRNVRDDRYPVVYAFDVVATSDVQS